MHHEGGKAIEPVVFFARLCQIEPRERSAEFSHVVLLFVQRGSTRVFSNFLKQSERTHTKALWNIRHGFAKEPLPCTKAEKSAKNHFGCDDFPNHVSRHKTTVPRNWFDQHIHGERPALGRFHSLLLRLSARAKWQTLPRKIPWAKARTNKVNPKAAKTKGAEKTKG